MGFLEKSDQDRQSKGVGEEKMRDYITLYNKLASKFGRKVKEKVKTLYYIILYNDVLLRYLYPNRNQGLDYITLYNITHSTPNYITLYNNQPEGGFCA